MTTILFQILVVWFALGVATVVGYNLAKSYYVSKGE